MMSPRRDAEMMTEFLLARIAEDEAVARRAERGREDHPWVVTGMDNAVGVDYNPARVLAECEAKRWLVWTYSDYPNMLSILAAIYSDHPDYDEAWKP